MAGRITGHELHRFRSGNKCDECGAKRYYTESGFRYCVQGHRIEVSQRCQPSKQTRPSRAHTDRATEQQGFIEFDIDEDDNYGQRGRVARKEREVRQKTTRHLSGNEARELYLECLQLVLRRQLWWLVHDRALPPELETVVRDLWDLRVRNFAGLKRTAASAVEQEEAAGSGADSGTDGELFSSQAGSASESDASTRTTVSRARSWTSEPGQDWNLPGLFHCLALCYLGCLSLSLPVRVGHIYDWARNDQLLFLGAFDSLPKEMTDRLPGSYHRALIVKHASLQGGELHQAVLELVLEYHLNYDMVFPPLNTPLQLFHYLRELALPGEPVLSAWDSEPFTD